MLAMITVSICLTSCGKEDVITDQDANITSANVVEEAYGLLIPEDISKQGEDKITEYVKSLSKEQRVTQINNFITSNFISKKVQLEDGQIQDFSQSNLSDYLSEEEIAELNSLLLQGDVEGRVCVPNWCYYCCGYIYKLCGSNGCF